MTKIGFLYIIDGDSKQVEELKQGSIEYKAPWYSSDETWATAYLVKPNASAPMFIEHQFDDVCCRHAYFRGLLLPITGPLGSQLDHLMRDSSPDKDRINHVLADFGMECQDVIGQGLISLVGGDFIMTEGND
jgi:hypothetical protein